MSTYRIVHVVLLVPTGDESAIQAIDDHALDHNDQLIAWGELPDSASKALTQEQAGAEFGRLTGRVPVFRDYTDAE